MKANEFKIGNLAQDKISKELLIVCGLNCDTDGKNSKIEFTLLNCSKYPLPNGWQAEPIPLTEERLVKFGFKKRITVGHSVQYFIGINPVTQDWLFDILWQEGQEFPFYRNGHFRIKYVHQLQNLYFALTGQELEMHEG